MVARTVLTAAGLTAAGLVATALPVTALDRPLAVFTLLLLAMSDEVPSNRERLLAMVQDLYRPAAGGWPWRATTASTACAARWLGACALSVITASSRANAPSWS